MSADTRLWQSRISALVRNVHEDLPGPRSLVLTGDVGDLTDACRDAVHQSGGVCIEISCADGGGEPFRPLRGVVEHILPIVHAEAIDLTEQLGAELVAIHPRLAASLGITPAHTLDEVANTPSERRSHRESERAFRIINSFARLLHGALDQCPSLKSGPIVLSWPGFAHRRRRHALGLPPAEPVGQPGRQPPRPDRVGRPASWSRRSRACRPGRVRRMFRLARAAPAATHRRAPAVAGRDAGNRAPRVIVCGAAGYGQSGAR